MIPTLSQSALAACSPVEGEGGRTIRGFCPFHGSDHQRSLRVDLNSGRFRCFACGIWGFMEGSQWKHSGGRRLTRVHIARRAYFGFKTELPPTAVPPALPEPQPVSAAVMEEYQSYRKALAGSLGERYLAERGIPLHMALRYQLGYAAPGKWAHRMPDGRPVRQWKLGRVVFPETDTQGRIVNLYGRAIGEAPKEIRHDHLPGLKGWFNTQVIRFADGPLFITEGVFDALSLIAAGFRCTLAVIGVNGLRWDWLAQIPEVVFAFDADDTGQTKAQQLAREAAVRGKQASVLPPNSYGGCKDANEAWQAGVLHLAGWE